MIRFKEFLEKNFQVSEPEWTIIESHFELHSLARNEFFVQQGKICRRAGFIVEGVMRYFGQMENGDEQTCYFAAENDYVVDPFSFPAQIPATSFNLQLVTDCLVAVITFEKDRELSQLFPAWPRISSELVQRALAEFANQKEMIAYDAGTRYERFVQRYPQLAQRLPLQFIASYLGIAQPSLSRLRKQLGQKHKAHAIRS